MTAARTPLRPRERVARAMRHQPADRVPKGEVCFPPGFLERLVGRPDPGFREAMLRALSILNADLVFIHLNPAWSGLAAVAPRPGEVRFWALETEYFVVAGVPGVFWPVAGELGFENAARLALTDPTGYRRVAARHRTESARLAQEALAAGAQGIAVLDDLAGGSGPFFSPRLLREAVLPELEELFARIRGWGAPVFLHSDGLLGSLAGDLVNIGVDVLHGQHDLDQLKRQLGERVTLMGGFNLDVSPGDGDTGDPARAVREALQRLGGDGGYILSTDGGLSPWSDPNRLRWLYSVAHDTGLAEGSTA